VRRGSVTGVYRSRFVLLGSMNPEEGRIRPQILDRFGLRVVVRGLADPGERLEAYRRSQAYLASPRGLAAEYSEETSQAREEIQAARDLLPRVTISDPVAELGIKIIQRLGIDSLRAELTLLESARALAAAGGRTSVEPGDLSETAPLALRLRRSDFMTDYLARQAAEEMEIGEISSEILA
jgi:magnesium chelatase subunit I